MTIKRLFVLTLSAAFLLSGAGFVAAQEKKVEDKKPAETPAAKAVEKAKNANGTVKAATADSLTVAGKGNREWTFAVDTKTAIRKAGKSVVLKDVKEGDWVYVQFTNTEGRLLAKSITVKAGGTAKKEDKK